MFKKLSSLLSSKFGRKDYLSKQLEIVKVFDIYQQRTGKRPISLKNKILTVPAQSSVEANELRFQESESMDRINQTMGKEVVVRIVYRF